MTKVYILTSGIYEDYRIIGVYESEVKARIDLAKHFDRVIDHTRIEIYELNTTNDIGTINIDYEALSCQS